MVTNCFTDLVAVEEAGDEDPEVKRERRRGRHCLSWMLIATFPRPGRDGADGRGTVVHMTKYLGRD